MVPKESNVREAYRLAKERYAELGVDDVVARVRPLGLH